MKKFLIGLLAVIVILVGGLSVYISTNGAGLIKSAVSDYGPQATGGSVSLGDISVSLLGGSAGISDLVMGNPEGFKTPKAISLGELSVSLDAMTLMDEVIIIREILIDAAEVTYELGGGGSNIGAIQNNIEKFSASQTSGAATTTDEAATSDASESGGPKVIIDRVVISNTKAGVSAVFLGGKEMSISLPDIVLTDIGKEEAGTPLSQAVGQIIGSLQKSLAEQTSKLDSRFKDALGGVTDTLKNLDTDALKDAPKDAGEKVKGLMDKLF